MPELKPAAQKLLREIAEHDHGGGVLFLHAPRSRYLHPHTGSVYNRRTFYPLIDGGLADDGGSDHTPVRITTAGRAWLKGAA